MRKSYHFVKKLSSCLVIKVREVKIVKEVKMVKEVKIVKDVKIVKEVKMSDSL